MMNEVLVFIMWPNHGGCFPVDTLLPLWVPAFSLELLVMLDLTLLSFGAHLDCSVVANAAFVSLTQLLVIREPSDSA